MGTGCNESCEYSLLIVVDHVQQLINILYSKKIKFFLKNLIYCLVKKKKLGVLLVFSWYPTNYDVTFKITNKLKVNTNNFKLNSNFKSHTIVKRTLGASDPRASI